MYCLVQLQKDKSTRKMEVFWTPCADAAYLRNELVALHHVIQHVMGVHSRGNISPENLGKEGNDMRQCINIYQQASCLLEDQARRPAVHPWISVAVVMADSCSHPATVGHWKHTSSQQSSATWRKRKMHNSPYVYLITFPSSSLTASNRLRYSSSPSRMYVFRQYS